MKRCIAGTNTQCNAVTDFLHYTSQPLLPRTFSTATQILQRKTRNKSKPVIYWLPISTNTASFEFWPQIRGSRQKPRQLQKTQIWWKKPRRGNTGLNHVAYRAARGCWKHYLRPTMKLPGLLHKFPIDNASCVMHMWQFLLRRLLPHELLKHFGIQLSTGGPFLCKLLCKLLCSTMLLGDTKVSLPNGAVLHWKLTSQNMQLIT